MNKNTEYEKLTQEIYQRLVNTDVLKPTIVNHNVKLQGKSGQYHQIDVYWEYKIAGIVHKVAIECKNYKNPIAIGKIRDFYGVLSDLNGVVGIMVTKAGYQDGAKKFASKYGISLKELRKPHIGEAIIAVTDINIGVSCRHCLFEVDNDWAKENNFDLISYKRFYDSISFSTESKWIYSDFVPLQTTEKVIFDGEGRIIETFENLEKQLNNNEDRIFKITQSYVKTVYGLIKINAIKYEFENETINKEISIDAYDFVQAILKDALDGEIRLIGI